MAISRSTPIDFAKIATEMRTIVSRWYNASVEIIDPSVENLAWDISTNSYTGDAAVSVWSGSARIQPISQTKITSNEISETSLVSIRVQVPYDNALGLIRKGMSIRVSDGGENHYLEELEFTIKSALNSSYGWNTTIECEVDAKSVANGSGS